MHKSTILSLVCLSALSVLAEGVWQQKKDKADDGVNRAAERYENQAEKLKELAQAEQDPKTRATYLELSEKNLSLADHKRKAAEAQKKGHAYDWKEYHDTEAEAKAMWKDLRAEKKATGKEVRKEKKAAHKETHIKKKEAHSKDVPSVKKGDSAKHVDTHIGKESKPTPKTYKTESGFKVRTSL